MSTRNIDTCREHLFAVLEGLTNKEKPMDIERAKAVCDTVQTIINTAKVEVDYVKAVGGTAKSVFLESKADANAALPSPDQTVEQRGAMRVITHRMRG